MKDRRKILDKEFDKILSSEVKNILLVRAGAGFGKTETVRKYIRKQKQSVVWIDLNASCNKLDRCYETVSQEVNKVYGSPHGNSAGFFFNQGQQEEGEKGLNNMYEIFRKIEDNKGIVLVDNLHVIHKKEVWNLLEQLLIYFPSIRWIFLGREKTEFLIRYIVSGKCFVVTESDLYLKQSEVEEILEQHVEWTKEQTVEAARKLMYYFRGWPAGIYEMTRYLQKHSIPGEKTEWERAIMDSWISDYIFYEVLNRIPECNRNALKYIAALPELNSSICNCVCQENGTEDMLERLEEKFFFLNKQDQVFALIPAFQIVLKSMLKTEELYTLSRIVTEYYFMRGEFEKANDFILSARQNKVVEYYLWKYGKTLIQEGKTELCIDCILYFLEQAKPASSQLLQFMAEVYMWIMDQNKEKREKKCDERKFCIRLLSFNQEPVKYSRYFMNFFDDFTVRKTEEKKIKVSSYGHFTVSVLEDGTELKWRTKKGCELFAFLYQMQGNPVERQVILNTLWPESMPKNGITMFHNMIYSIRKQLIPYGLEGLICYKENKYSLNMKYIISDLEQHNQLYQCRKKPALLIEHESELLEYPGQYLGILDADWMIELKEYHDKQYIECCIMLAREYMKQKNYGKSILLLRNALMIDNLREDVVENLLFCYSRLNDRKAVKAEYETFRQLLNKELGVEPCEKVKLMYKRGMKV